MSELINALRPKFNMDDEKEVAAWDLMNDIQKEKFDTLLLEFVADMIKEVEQIDEQIATVEKQRLRSLKDKALRTQCREILDQLRKDRDGFRKTLGSETYKRMVAELRRRTLQPRY